MKTLLIIVSVFTFSTVLFSQDIPDEARKEILDVFDKQKIAWNNGDMEEYMDGYWCSDSLRFINKDGITTGWKEILARYKKEYPTKSEMGILAFYVSSLERLTDASMFMVGKWTLFTAEKSVFGHFSIIWKKINGKWRIVTNHTS